MARGGGVENLGVSGERGVRDTLCGEARGHCFFSGRYVEGLTYKEGILILKLRRTITRMGSVR